jgi:hypothetical protein
MIGTQTLCPRHFPQEQAILFLNFKGGKAVVKTLEQLSAKLMF